MDDSEAQTKFEIRPVIEQTPFEDLAVQSFFRKWCEINDSIEPKIIDRRQWEQKTGEGVLEKRPDDKHWLYMPKDLKLWEMVGVMEAVEEYQKFIGLADIAKDFNLIRKAKSQILILTPKPKT